MFPCYHNSSGTDRLGEGSRTVDNPAPGMASIAELRREMSRQREREIAEFGRGGTDARLRPPPEPAARDPYMEIKERKLAEERRYQQLPAEQNLHHRRKQWGDSDGQGPPNGPGPPNVQTAPQRWEDDELHLMQWAKGRSSVTAQKASRDHPTTPPSHHAILRKEEEAKGTRRSISAPIVTGMAAIGVKESDMEKKNRQRQYAEELKAQIRDKTLAKQREKGMPTDVPSSETFQLRARSQRGNDSPPGDGGGSRWKEVEGRTHDPPPRGRWSPPRDYPGSRHHAYSPPDPHKQPGRHRYSPPGDHFYGGGPSHHYPPGPDPRYPPYHPPYPPYMYRPDYNAFVPPAWPQPYYPPTLHPPHPYGPNPYYPPSFPRDGPTPSHWQHSEGEEYKTQNGPTEEPQGEGRQQPGAPAANSKEPKKDKSAYRSQLKQQMEEKRMKEEHGKAKVAEVQEYNPWGKGGGGAPMRDERGRLVADLRKMRMVNNEKLLKSSLTSPRGESTAPSGDRPPPGAEPSPSKESGPVTGAPTGGEECPPQGLEDYRDSLRRQMEEREAVKKKEKEAKKLEDLKELERIKSEQQRIEENYRREQEMARKRETDARARNALLKREAEDKRTTEASKKLEGADESRRFASDSHSQPFAPSVLDDTGGRQEYRASSPPVPALKHLLRQRKGFSELPPSPPALQQVPSQPQPFQNGPSPPSLRRALTPPLIQRVPSPPVPALRKKLQSDLNQGQKVTPLSEGTALKPQQSTHSEFTQPRPVEFTQPRPVEFTQPRPVEFTQATPVDFTQPRPIEFTQPRPVEFTQPRPLEPQVPKPQQDSAKLLRELSAIKKHLQSEHAKLAAKMLPIHRTEGTGSQAPPVPGSSAHSTFGGTVQNGLIQQPSYLPPTQQPSYLPPTQQPSYLPPTQQPSYLPPTQQPSYLPPTQQPSYLPPTQQPSNHPSIQHTSSLWTSDSNQAAVSTRPLARVSRGLHQEPSGPLLTSDSEQLPIVEQVSANPQPTKPQGSRRQWDKLEPRQSSASSGASVTTFDLDAIAAQNEERQRRLEAILNAGALRDPQTVLQDFLNRTSRGQAVMKPRDGASNAK